LINAFKNKTLLITGGTGSFGSTVLNKLLDKDMKEIRVFSRDEKKQHDLRLQYNHPSLNFVIGDIRDYFSCLEASKGVDYIYHAAAMKQVPSSEFFPMEAIKTNIIGANNLFRSAIENEVSKVIALSTDKAAYPVNSMGMTKALMEKLLFSFCRGNTKDTTFCCTRYGNVLASRGSVVPLFINQILEKRDITITNENMTRFVMNLDEAVDLVEFAFKEGQQGDLLIQKSPSSTILDLAEALKEIFQSKDSKIKIIGKREGEKMHETLLTSEELSRSEEMKRYFRVVIDSQNNNYSNYFDEGNKEIDFLEGYNSGNTTRLTKEQLITKLLELDLVKSKLN
tara:strand:- start:2788 stop:3804 length:1017 start_codon:yes stop_codon:yes gene_type:complete